MRIVHEPTFEALDSGGGDAKGGAFKTTFAVKADRGNIGAAMDFGGSKLLADLSKQPAAEALALTIYFGCDLVYGNDGIGVFFDAAGGQHSVAIAQPIHSANAHGKIQSDAHADLLGVGLESSERPDSG